MPWPALEIIIDLPIGFPINNIISPLAGVCFFSGCARPCQGAANVASESLWWMRARQAGGVPEEASARAMTAGLAFPIVYPPAHRRARTAECSWHFQDELKDKIR